MIGAASDLDYFRLLKEAKTLKLTGSERKIRLALLADCSVQHLATIVKVLGLRSKLDIEIFEGGYDAIDLEVLNPASSLYAFKPDFVFVFPHTEKLKARFYASTREGFAQNEVERFRSLWTTFAQNSSATLIQANLVQPSERAFGEFEGKVATSLGSTVRALNEGLVEAAREHANVLLCDLDHLAGEIGRRNWYDERMWCMAKVPCRTDNLPQLGRALLDVLLAATGTVVKCVVLDLDNTLWGGVIGDDGVDGIALGGFDDGEAFVGFQNFILELKRRGLILAVVSKNELSNAKLPFQNHPDMVLKEEDISVFIANWDNKADNIREVQRILNIGFDSMVFLDDNPFERNIVRQFLPDVIVPELPEEPSQYVRFLANSNLFHAISFTSEDAKRGDLYRVEAQRELGRKQYADVNEYLRSLGMAIRTESFNDRNLSRIAQLIQRSNQFNLATRRYGEATCKGLMSDDSAVPFTVSLADRFGDYGLISVVVLKQAGRDLEIDELLMSCRVLQRGVEDHIMNLIFEIAAERGLERVVGRFIPTAKNAMVKDFYGRFGFERQEGAKEDTWTLPVSAFAARPTQFIEHHTDI